MKNIPAKETIKQNRKELSDRFWHSVDLKLQSKGRSRTWLAEKTGLTLQSFNQAVYLSSSLRTSTVFNIMLALDCSIGEMIYGIKGLPQVENRKMPVFNPVRADLRNMVENDFERLTAEERLLLLFHVASYMGINHERFEEEFKKEIWI